MRPDERVQAVRAAFRGGSANLRGKTSLTVDAGPNEVRNAAGDVVGVEVWVTLRDNGTVVPIDPHRVVVNPPTIVKTGSVVGDDTSDPEAALWAVLWDSVTDHPGRTPTAVFRKASP